MMNHPADPEERASPVTDVPDVPGDSSVDRVPVVFFCVIAVWMLVVAVLLLRLLAGQI